MASKRWGEVGISAGMALLAVAFYSLATFRQEINPIDPGPAVYPRVVSLLLFVFSAVQVFLSWKRRDSLEEGQDVTVAQTTGQAYKLSLGTLALSILYVAFFDKANYLVTTTAFLLALMFLGGVRKWLVLLGVALCYSLATYYVFGQILMVPLP
jgi:putative tricarboxylic transport membrane protein